MRLRVRSACRLGLRRAGNSAAPRRSGTRTLIFMKLLSAGTTFVSLPGPNLQRATLYSWDTALTRYFNERLGVTLDGRGYYGTAYVGLNPTSITRPAISQYGVLVGPTYRFYLRPRYSLAGRVMGGLAEGNFSGDTSGFGTQELGLVSGFIDLRDQRQPSRRSECEPGIFAAAGAGVLRHRLRIDAAKQPGLHVWVCVPVREAVKKSRKSETGKSRDQGTRNKRNGGSPGNLVGRFLFGGLEGCGVARAHVRRSEIQAFFANNS